MAVSVVDLHQEFLKACLEGDLNHVLQLAYYNTDLIQSLLTGEVGCATESETFPGDFLPGEYIHAACILGHHELVAQLINLGADPTQVTRLGTPLDVACRNGKLEIVRLLHTSGADIQPEGKEIWDTGVFGACQNGYLDIVQYIISSKPELLSQKTEGFPNGCILFYAACEKGKVDVAKYLAEKGVDINALVFKRDGSLSIPLDAACASGSYELIDYFLLQHAELPKTTIEQYPFMFKPTFQSMIKRFNQPPSLRGLRNEGDPSRSSLSVFWNEKNLRGFHDSWFDTYAHMISFVHLQENKITELPPSFFELLQNLHDINLSLNQLSFLPERGLSSCRLQRLIASKNQLQSVPLALFKNRSVQVVDLSGNKLKHLPPHGSLDSFMFNEIWECDKLQSLKLVENMLIQIPKGIHGATSLERLNVSRNKLTFFVTPWNCPLNELDLSGNELVAFEESVHLYWAKTLTRLNLAGNKLAEISQSVCKLENLVMLDLSHNLLERLPPYEYWSLKCLNKMNLSHNLLSANSGPTGFTDVEKTSIEAAIALGDSLCFASDCEFPYEMLKNTLHSLDLSDNRLETVPDTICMLTSLGELNLSNNPRLTRLPPELGNLRNIWNLKLDNLSLPDVPQNMRVSGGVKKILAMLRARLRKSVPFKRMKLMVVGLQGRGKTTLLATLQGKRAPLENVATDGINVEQWHFQPSSNQWKITKFFTSQNTEGKEILFSTWDLAGQHVYYATHQCFLTSNTLYLVVWNLEHGEEGIDGLAPWLLNIQARAPKSQVIAVGTHLDRLPSAKKSDHLKKLEHKLFSKFNQKGFPTICGNVFVSNVTEEGLPKLREVVHKVALKMQDCHTHEPIIGKMVPLSYLQLYDAVTKEAELRAASNKPPILTADELLQIAKDNPDNDIYDTEELNHAAKFLHEHGVLLHYNDYLRGLNNLYFIDPKWLCDMIALVVTVRQKNPFVKGGYILDSDIKSVLKCPRLPADFIPQYLQILERFEIALRLDEERILVPSMLPKERPILHIERATDFGTKKNSNRLSQLATLSRGRASSQQPLIVDHILRNYHLMYVPAGFWSRLIARLIIAVHKWGMIVTGQESEEVNDVTPNKQGTRIGMKTNNYSMVYWREGILVSYKSGKFLVESFKDNSYEQQFLIGDEYQYGNEGVSITVWSDYGDFSVMGFIVDQVDRLITEWYPGLEDLDEYGIMVVQRMIPCPACVMVFHEKKLAEYDMDSCGSLDISSYVRNPTFVNQFPLTVCAIAALNHDRVFCQMHPDRPVPLTHLVPDILLSDLPSSLVLEKEKLDLEESNWTKLGTGGMGAVFKANYDGEPIAIKRFHSSKSTRDIKDEMSTREGDTSLFVPHEQSVSDHLIDGKVVRSFWELRQEVAMLCRLQHPCIVRMIGVCRIPLCFGLELAPKGGLYNILEEINHERELVRQRDSNSTLTMGSVLGRKLTFKIALQVAHALLYLHDSEIVYRDLKSDNILVWSLDEDAVINVKLSDYGISCFATPQGIVGESGTPGFQAPEIKIGCAYDEKVDIFSFGVWLYELVSGFRPLREHKTCAEIRKAVYNGIRPSLQKVNIASQLPFMERLMQDCWVGEPEARPSAVEVVRRMERPEFLCLCNSFPAVGEKPLENVTCVLSLEEDFMGFNMANATGEHFNKLLIWSAANKGRRFIIMNANTGTVESDIPCIGQRVLCAARVNQRIWLGTEGLKIEVFGMHMWQFPRILWSFGTKDAVMDILAEQKEGAPHERVFVSLANGTLIVFQKNGPDRYEVSEPCQPQTQDGEEKDDLITSEKNSWFETVIYLANEGRPAKKLALTKGGKELWVASGNSVAIVDTQNLQLIEKVKVFALPRHLVTHMVTDGERVWTSERNSTIIYQWDVETRQKTYIFDCDITCNAKGIILGQLVKNGFPSERTAESLATTPANLVKLDSSGLDEIAESNSGLEDIAECAEDIEAKEAKPPVDLLAISPLLLKATRRAQPSFLLSQKKRRVTKSSRRLHFNAEHFNLPTRPRSGAYSDASLRLGPILLKGNTLLVGRSVGDILVINVCKPTTPTVTLHDNLNTFVFGEVLCQIEDEQGKQPDILKEVTCFEKVGNSRVVAAMRIESKKEGMRERLNTFGSVGQIFDAFKLLSFEAWDISEFENFATNVSSLHSMEQS